MTMLTVASHQCGPGWKHKYVGQLCCYRLSFDFLRVLCLGWHSSTSEGSLSIISSLAPIYMSGTERHCLAQELCAFQGSNTNRSFSPIRYMASTPVPSPYGSMSLFLRKRLAQEQNAMSPAKAPSRTTQSETSILTLTPLASQLHKPTSLAQPQVFFKHLHMTPLYDLTFSTIFNTNESDNFPLTIRLIIQMMK